MPTLFSPPLSCLLLITLIIGWYTPHTLHAQALTCPGPSTTATGQLSRKPGQLADTAQLPINLQADSWDATINGEINLNGQVQAQQGERSLSADALHYDLNTRNITATGTVQYQDDSLLLSGSDAHMSADGGAEVAQASFMFKTSAGRGTAERIQLSPAGNVALDSVRYTTCPPGDTDWELRLSDLDINQQTGTGTGRNVRLEFQGVPIFYTPWISFPVSNQRKSGFLFPTLGGSSRGGNALSIPWYWNLAANYDDTITPTYDTSRGFKLDNEFRYLGERSKGTLLAGYLPHDHRTQDWRGLVQLNYRNDFTEALRLDINAAEVRDNEWFEDFGATREVNSAVYLARTLAVSTHSREWHAELSVQNLQVIDSTLALADHPYTQLPQLTVAGHQALPLGAEFNLDSELTRFTRGVMDRGTQQQSITGSRLYLLPELTLPLRSHGLYLTPSARWHYSHYQLQNTAPGANRHPTLSAPLYSLDTGLVLERLSGSQQQRLYTLEPRLLYTYVPYRAQTEVPVFDTAMPDFNLVQLFQPNRFIGPDRLGDTNQLSAGITTRMLDARDGRQFLSGTLGQAYYFKTPCVTSLTRTTCSSTGSDRSSDLIGQLSLSAYRNWSVNAGVQWNPSSARSERSDLFFQYRPAPDRTVNLGYRYDRTAVEQWESSVAWPISHAWSGYGRVVYSRPDHKFLDHFGGLEYRSCCWNIRAVVGRTITTRTGAYDTQYKLQLELKGLSSVGTADAFLASSIPGYSAR